MANVNTSVIVHHTQHPRRWPAWPAIVVTVMAAGLVACASSRPPQEPIADNQARITFSTQPMDNLRAHRLNGELVRGLSFDDIPAGAHRLDVRFRFERPGGGQPGLRDSQQHTCDLRIHYPAFEGGQRYVIRAELFHWRPRGWLQNAAGERLADADVVHCSPG
ncbi:PA0061/PA0062 family lipoprotein [Halopseudomonas salegens]|uniref:Lipoprotein n=1 Tax=Halopseudomonas salegens TaxID=1434072 RepID=A0A1H2G4H6_9GAMM|nr:hypothetical protein [Halopseudomonas salegens]SDU14475.1 hypothetical protein SAMN05216210_2033 [Halopseudomonas salegens]